MKWKNLNSQIAKREGLQVEGGKDRPYSILSDKQVSQPWFEIPQEGSQNKEPFPDQEKPVSRGLAALERGERETERGSAKIVPNDGKSAKKVENKYKSLPYRAIRKPVDRHPGVSTLKRFYRTAVEEGTKDTNQS